MPMENELLGNNPRTQNQERCNACDELFASRPKRPDEYHENFILRGESL